MTKSRRLGITGVLLGAIGLTSLLAGCSGSTGVGPNAGPAPNPEVQVVPPVDASGKVIPTDETTPPPK